jgi:hypothetical protein
LGGCQLETLKFDFFHFNEDKKINRSSPNQSVCKYLLKKLRIKISVKSGIREKREIQDGADGFERFGILQTSDFIYLDLSVRLKKSTRFSLFFALKTAGFSAFFTRFFTHRVKTR